MNIDGEKQKSSVIVVHNYRYSLKVGGREFQEKPDDKVRTWTCKR